LCSKGEQYIDLRYASTSVGSINMSNKSVAPPSTRVGERIYDVTDWTWIVVAPILLLVGTIGNI
jgi:hypothetical protein